ncbi:MAG: hypothetical protein ACREBK_03990 [Sphingomicrobium sp.]
MSDPNTESERRARRRWINFGETVALAALTISAAGLWINWQERNKGPTEVVEKARAIPLVLRGTVADDGRRLTIGPVEDGHALESLTLALPGGKTIELGSDGALDAGALEAALPDAADRKGNGRITAKIDARYVEAGSERRSSHAYAIRYRWEGGGLFGGKSLRLTGLSRA